jgi:1-acyl-sn-glycerol-3-phosphate acyltransferase
MLRVAKFILIGLYGLYAWSTFVVLGLLTTLAVVIAPTLKARRAIGWLCANAWLKLAGVSIELRGRELLPAGPAVVVANHSSYVDGVLLKAVLPTRFTFVIKKEMTGVPLAGLLLRRLGAEFVDRFNRQSGAVDARRLMRAATSGTSLVFFPEGTFSGKPGLDRFHGGAFTIAARAAAPVAPIVIRGARHILRGDSIWPRPGRVVIEVLPHIDSTQRSAHELRDQSRARILLALGEPDLLDASTPAALAAESD